MAQGRPLLDRNYSYTLMADVHGDEIRYEENRAASSLPSSSSSSSSSSSNKKYKQNDSTSNPSPFRILSNELNQSILLKNIQSMITDRVSDTELCKRVAELCYSVSSDTMSKPGDAPTSLPTPPSWVNCDTQTFWDEINRMMHFYTDRELDVYYYRTNIRDIGWNEFVRRRRGGRIIFIEQTEDYQEAWEASGFEHPWWASAVPTTPKEHFLYMCKKRQLASMPGTTVGNFYEVFDLEQEYSFLAAFWRMFDLTAEQIQSGVQMPAFTTIMQGMLTSEDEGKWYGARPVWRKHHTYMKLFRNFHPKVRFSNANIAMTAVKQRWKNLRHVGTRLQTNPFVVYAAMTTNPEAARFMQPELAALRTFVNMCMDTFESNPNLFYYNDRYGTHPTLLPHDENEVIHPFFAKVSDEIKSDVDFARRAVLLDGSNMSWAPQSLKRNVEFVKDVILREAYSVNSAEEHVDADVLARARELYYAEQGAGLDVIQD